MDHAETKELSLARWTQLINDPSLEDLPYKIELNSEGTIEMSPVSNMRGLRQADIAGTLGSSLPHGRVVIACSVLTRIGIRVADVAWASKDFLDVELYNTPFARAPEICVEVRSKSHSNRGVSERVQAYLAAGAIEVWVADEDGTLKMYSTSGELTQSQFNVKYESK